MGKILFMIKSMNIGGVEKALLQMLNEIPRGKYDITVLMLEEFGGFLKYIPDNIKINFLKGYCDIKRYVNDPPQLIALDMLKKRKYLKSFNIFFCYLISKFSGNMEYYYSYILNRLPTIDEDYDVAVAYDGPMDLISYFVAKKVKAKKKIQWIHFDVTTIYMNIKFNKKIYRMFDKICVVSRDGKKKFTKLFPELEEKTEVFHNIISPREIRKQAQKGTGFIDEFDGLRILTVGRLSKEKGQDLTIRVLARLRKDGYNVKWYCIGEGNARAEYEQLIKNSGVDDDYILLGAYSNPYPFMKTCDLYVQPSRYEGYCITLAEARCFANPIIATNFTGAKEQLRNEQNGLIVDCEEQQIYNAVKRVLNDETLRKRIKQNLPCKSINNKKNIMELWKVFR